MIFILLQFNYYTNSVLPFLLHFYSWKKYIGWLIPVWKRLLFKSILFNEIHLALASYISKYYDMANNLNWMIKVTFHVYFWSCIGSPHVSLFIFINNKKSNTQDICIHTKKFQRFLHTGHLWLHMESPLKCHTGVTYSRSYNRSKAVMTVIHSRMWYKKQLNKKN